MPLNRIIAFCGPYISIASGAVASYLLVHVHFLGLFHVQHDGLSTAIAQGVTFALTAAIVWAGHSKWLTGWQNYEAQIQQHLLAHAVDGDLGEDVDKRPVVE